MGEFGVSDKGATKNSSISNSTATSVVGLGVNKVQNLEAFPSKTMMMTMMAHHNHHHRPLSVTPFDNDFCAGAAAAAGDGDGDGDGPMSLTNHINLVNGAHSALASAIHCGGAATSVTPLQPFDISAYTPSATTTRPSFKSPEGMVASLGFPTFTNAQWKELERQAMIYKYMMASIPVPSHLLLPTPAASRSPLDGGFYLRLSSSNTDPEPGRCKRTDGKKWRCSRDVATPNHKYCERHMNRGRPRSRKPVEVQSNINNNNQQIKRARHDYQPFPPTSGVTVAISNPTIIKDGSSSQFLASTTTTQPYLESSLSLHNFEVKAANFDSLSSVSPNKEPRGLDWLLKGDSDWQPLMHDKIGLTSELSISSPKYEEPPYLNSYVLHDSGLVQQKRHLPLFLNNPLVVPLGNLQSEKPRVFIDAWSNTGGTDESKANTNNKSSASVESIGKLSLSCLDLSMGGGTAAVDEEMATTGVGLGLIMDPDNGNTQNDTKTLLTNWLNPEAPWVASTTPGGPLAEVLRPSTVAATTDAASNPPSPVRTQAESSPSGVLQKTLASLSDSSSNSSPNVASSRANSEIGMPMLWFNQK